MMTCLSVNSTQIGPLKSKSPGLSPGLTQPCATRLNKAKALVEKHGKLCWRNR
jgi:hypothetical protein